MSDKDQFTVDVTPLEKDDMIYHLQRRFFIVLKQESGFQNLQEKEKEEVNTLFDTLKNVSFESVESLQKVVKQFIQRIPGLEEYVGIAIRKAREQIEDELYENKGVLVIYSGGTIGSAPKDINDPESPQVVKKWKELKASIPNLERIGFRVDAISFVLPLDSCNVFQHHWIKMAEIIYDHYKEYEGFVILHGTDTMVYSASALSFILQELNKPIIITGSQIAGIVPLRNDAHQNFITSLYIANPKASKIPIVPEVCIFFGNKLIRGCRSKKIDSSGYLGFDSPNYPLLGTAGDQIEINKKRLRNVSNSDMPCFYKKLRNTVITIDVFPGIQSSAVVEKLLNDESLVGVVLRSYGTGNVPTNQEFLDLFYKVTKKICITNVSQCIKGSVEMGLYETSQVLLDRGIISGFDITPEAALVKLMLLIGVYGNNIETVKEMMQQSLVGEQLYSVYSTIFDDPGSLQSDNKRIDLKRSELNSVEHPELIDKAILRFHNVKLTPAEGKELAVIKLFVDANGETLNESSEKYIGTYTKAKVPSDSEENVLVENNDVPESLAFDISLSKELLVLKQSTSKMKTKPRISFSVLMDEKEQGTFSWDKVELDLFITD